MLQNVHTHCSKYFFDFEHMNVELEMLTGKEVDMTNNLNVHLHQI